MFVGVDEDECLKDENERIVELFFFVAGFLWVDEFGFVMNTMNKLMNKMNVKRLEMKI